jgi:hypothetical protein
LLAIEVNNGVRPGVRAGFLAGSLSAATCADEVEKAEGAGCRDDPAALRLKWVAMAAILVAGVVGVGLPLAGRKRRAVRTGSAVFVAAKAFAAGVILATGFVHMLHDSEHALSSPCLPAAPWRRFPFPGFVAMLAALATLVLDVLVTGFYEGKHRAEVARVKADAAAALAASTSAGASDEDITVVTVVAGDEHKAPLLQPHSHSHSHSHGHELVQTEGREGEVSEHVRSVVVSQVVYYLNLWIQSSVLAMHSYIVLILELVDTGDGDRVALCDHWAVAGGVTEPLHNQAAGGGALVPPVLRGFRSRWVHCAGEEVGMDFGTINMLHDS